MYKQGRKYWHKYWNKSQICHIVFFLSYIWRRFSFFMKVKKREFTFCLLRISRVDTSGVAFIFYCCCRLFMLLMHLKIVYILSRSTWRNYLSRDWIQLRKVIIAVYFYHWKVRYQFFILLPLWCVAVQSKLIKNKRTLV